MGAHRYPIPLQDAKSYSMDTSSVDAFSIGLGPDRRAESGASREVRMAKAAG